MKRIQKKIDHIQRFTVGCDQCGKQVDWEKVQIVPNKNLCLKCLVYSNFKYKITGNFLTDPKKTKVITSFGKV